MKIKSFLLIAALILCSFMLSAQNFNGSTIFVWDNDAGLKFRNPDNPEKFIGYEENLIKSLSMLGVTTENKNLAIDTKLPSDPTKYQAIFIVCGHRGGDPAKDSLFRRADIAFMGDYIGKFGGKVYMEGNNIVEYLAKVNPEFMATFFNNKLSDNGGTGFNLIDTIITDTAQDLMHNYKFMYPAGTSPDSSVDYIAPVKADTAYHSVLVYNPQKSGKLYKSTATAYTPPDASKGEGVRGRTYMQTTSDGAFYLPDRQGKALPDTLLYQIARASYIRDIMRYFGLARTLIVKDDERKPESEKGLVSAYMDNNIQFDLVDIGIGSNGPNIIYLQQYASVLWYTGIAQENLLTPTDTVSVRLYLQYGGDMILSGNSIAASLGKAEVAKDTLDENPLLARYFRVDYVARGDAFEKFYSPKSCDLFYYPYTDYVVSPVSKTVNMLRPFMYSGVDTAYILDGTKAPVISGVVNDVNDHKTIFLSFAMEYIDNQRSLDSMISRVYLTLFDYASVNYTTETNDKTMKEPFTASVSGVHINYSGGILTFSSVESISVFDVQGREVLNVENGAGGGSVKAELKSGIYFAKYKNGTETGSRKLLVF